MLGPEEVDDLALAQAAIGVAFRAGGTAVGPGSETATLPERRALLPVRTGG